MRSQLDSLSTLVLSRVAIPSMSETLTTFARTVSPKERLLRYGLTEAEGKVIEGGEITVRPAVLREAADLLFYLTLSALSEKGFLYHIGEVYRVTSYDVGDGVKEVDLFNNRSFGRMIKTGATYLGEGPEKALVLRGLRVTVRPTLVRWEIKPAAEKLKERLLKSGIII